MARVDRLENERQAVVVLGMHRGGTSALAGVAARLGLVPPRTPIPACSDNPLGFYELQPIVVANQQLQLAAGCSWNCACILTWRPTQTAVGSDARRLMLHLLRLELGITGHCAKDPRLCVMLPLWRPVLQAGRAAEHVSIVLRHPTRCATELAPATTCPRHKPPLCCCGCITCWRQNATAACRGPPDLRRPAARLAGARWRVRPAWRELSGRKTLTRWRTSSMPLSRRWRVIIAPHTRLPPLARRRPALHQPGVAGAEPVGQGPTTRRHATASTTCMPNFRFGGRSPTRRNARRLQDTAAGSRRFGYGFSNPSRFAFRSVVGGCGPINPESISRASGPRPKVCNGCPLNDTRRLLLVMTKAVLSPGATGGAAAINRSKSPWWDGSQYAFLQLSCAPSRKRASTCSFDPLRR